MPDGCGSVFVEVDFRGSHCRGVDFSIVKISDARLVDVDISGSGVDVTDFVEEQLDKRYPVRKLLTAPDPVGMRGAFFAFEQPASQTVDRARRLPSGLLDGSVDDEWSFLQTLRRRCVHVVFKRSGGTTSRRSATWSPSTSQLPTKLGFAAGPRPALMLKGEHVPLVGGGL